MGNRRCSLLQQPEPFATHRSFESRESCKGVTRPPQILHEARSFRIGHEHEDNRNAPVFYSGRGRGRTTDNNIRSHHDDLVRSNAHLIEFGAWPTIIEIYITAQFPAQFRQALFKSVSFRLSARIARKKST